MAEQERLQKFLARAGVASRRASEALITAGRVRVNGRVVTELGTKVDPYDDTVEFDGERVSADVRNVYMMVHKPPAMISAASDPEGRPVVTKLVPADYGRLFPVGRLDWDSEGAILLTNDGELANLLTHPRHEVAKTYMVKVKGLWADDHPKIAALREGVRLDDGHVTAPAQIIRDEDTGKHTWFLVSIHEGRNRQIRRMFEAVHIDVLRLRRIAYGSVTLGDLPPGGFRRLTEGEIEELYEAAGSKRPEMAASRGRLAKSTRAASARRNKAAKHAPKRLYGDVPSAKQGAEGGARSGKPAGGARGPGKGGTNRRGPSAKNTDSSRRNSGASSRNGGRNRKK